MSVSSLAHGTRTSAIALSSDDFEFLVAHAALRCYRRLHHLVERGDRGERLFLVVDGCVESYIESCNARTLVGRKRAGDCFGELTMLSGLPNPTSVVTVEDSLIAILDRPTFEDCVLERPGIMTAMTGQLGRAVADLTERLAALPLDAYGRLRFNLYRLARPRDDVLVVEGRWTQQHLAELSGCARETIGKLMTELKRGDWISCDADGIVLRKPLPASF